MTNDEANTRTVKEDDNASVYVCKTRMRDMQIQGHTKNRYRSGICQHGA